MRTAITRRALVVGLLALGLAPLVAAAAPVITHVYVTEHGTHYHTFRDCIALKRAKPEHVHELDLHAAEAAHYTRCAICQARKPKPATTTEGRR